MAGRNKTSLASRKRKRCQPPLEGRLPPLNGRGGENEGGSEEDRLKSCPWFMGKFSPTKQHGDCEEIANSSTAYGRRRRN
jgi:hypothetical protein